MRKGLGDLNTWDEACYLQRYPDVRNTWTSGAYNHWITYGQSEGRIPGCDPPGTIYSDVYDEVEYLRRYPDIRNNWHSDYYEHWIRYGKQEGRHPGKVYYPDLTPVDTTPTPTPVTDPTPTPDPTTTGGGSSTMIWVGLAAAAVLFFKRSKYKRRR